MLSSVLRAENYIFVNNSQIAMLLVLSRDIIGLFIVEWGYTVFSHTFIVQYFG